MDGRQNRRIETDQPIARPGFPLPSIFNRAKELDAPTRQRRRPSSPTQEQAHFYKKETSEFGTPVYSFYITTERPQQEQSK